MLNTAVEDHSVPTEDSAIDIPDLIQNALDQDDAADVSLVDRNDNEVEEPSIPYVNLKLAFDYLNGLRYYFLRTEGANGLESCIEAEANLEIDLTTKPKHQATITDFFKGTNDK
ncbi:hypothetical protein TKK_0002052 [Trichogramma kaykai]|uniref:Uncharacterized protein n=1 Tax=Trichogramma kaykai TaxID=54128 RepID=A0ABD2X9L7_9HYME